MPSVKVFWSLAEREQLIVQAIDLQRESPELAGLPLLRRAMYALPTARRRKLVTLSQVPWFEPGLLKETKSRDSLSGSCPPNLSLINIKTALDSLTEQVAKQLELTLMVSRQLTKILDILKKSN